MTGAPDEAAELLRVFESLGLRYMVTGGLAAILYGEARFTRDVDVVLAPGRHDLARLHEALDAERFYVPPLEAMQEEAAREAHGHFNLYDNATDFRADVYLAGANALEAWALDHARRVTIAPGLDVRVSPPEYVIAHKLTFRRDGASEKHVRDVRAMLAVSGDLLDRALLADLVDRLGVRAQWDEVVRGAL